MKPVFITQNANQTLEEIFRYIHAQDTALAAHRWTNKLLDAAIQIAKYPELGVLMPEHFGKNVRRIRIKKYYIYYMETGKHIDILAFIHSARDQAAAMKRKSL